VSLVDSQMKTPLARQNHHFPTCDETNSNESGVEQMHPDDLNGLREWVRAKQNKFAIRNAYFRTCTAPWRVG